MISGSPNPPAGGDTNRGPQILAVAIVTTAIVVISCIIRLFVRFRIVRSVGSDDYIISIATVSLPRTNMLICSNERQVFAVVGAGFLCAEVHNGLGRHEYYLTLEQILTATRLGIVAQLWILMSTCLSKISGCLFLLRVIVHQNRTWDYFLYSLMILLFTINVGCSIAILVECRPVKGIWSILLAKSCWSSKTRLPLALLQGGMHL